MKQKVSIINLRLPVKDDIYSQDVKIKSNRATIGLEKAIANLGIDTTILCKKIVARHAVNVSVKFIFT